MKRSLLLLIILFVVSFTTTYSQYADITESFSSPSTQGTEAIWDVKFNYDMDQKTGGLGNAGCVYIPSIQRFWTSRWAATTGNTGKIHIWNTAGTVVDSFVTTGFNGTRGMVFDGQYVYHSINTTTLQKVDPVTHATVGTVVMTGVPNGARFIAYDPTAHAGAGGFWVGNWTAPNLNFYLIPKTGGAPTRTITNTQTGVYGLAYDNFSVGGPFLWVWTQGGGAGQPQLIRQMNATTGVYTAIQHDVRTDVGVGQPTTTGIAGGMFITDQLYAGKITLGGIWQGVPDRFFGYELGDVVPVELTSFTANVNGTTVQLNWATATETNNRGFEIQKKSANGQFVNVGFVNGKGTTTEAQNYSFIDKAEPGTYSYRLRQVDFNGNSDITKAVEVVISSPTKFALANNYPNPFNPSTKISFSLSVDSKVSLRVYNLLGQEVSSLVNGNLTAGSHEVNFNASNLSTGVYMYKLEASGIDGQSFTSVKKMVLNK